VQYEALAIDYLRGTEDHEEGARAFLEKREPIFKGK
jgi:enoyl-CoA hydratase/carnithine racemase